MKIYDFEKFAASDQFGVGEPNTAYAEFFDGQSYLNPINDGEIRLVNVTFEPGCRTHWHVRELPKAEVLGLSLSVSRQ